MPTAVVSVVPGDTPLSSDPPFPPVPFTLSSSPCCISRQLLGISLPLSPFIPKEPVLLTGVFSSFSMRLSVSCGDFRSTAGGVFSSSLGGGKIPTGRCFCSFPLVNVGGVHSLGVESFEVRLFKGSLR